MRLTLSTLYICLSATSAAANPDAAFTVEREYGVTTVMGAASSAAHEAILRDSAVRFFPDSDVRFELARPIAAPPGWALVTDMALRAAATLNQGRIEIAPTKFVVTGVTANEAAWNASLIRVTRARLNGMTIEENVVSIQSELAHEDLCRQQLRYLSEHSAIEFERMSAQPGSGAQAHLDAVLELSFDCPQLDLEVIGHTEASGREARQSNLALRRARAVMARLRAAGLSSDRVTAAAANPADTATSAFRHDRRVEIRARR